MFDKKIKVGDFVVNRNNLVIVIDSISQLNFRMYGRYVTEDHRANYLGHDQTWCEPYNVRKLRNSESRKFRNIEFKRLMEM